MSTLETTISMMEMLPDADLLKIQNFIRTLFSQHNVENPLPFLSEEDILRDMETSEKQFAGGQYTNAKQVINEIREEYGL